MSFTGVTVPCSTASVTSVMRRDLRGFDATELIDSNALSP